MCIRDRGYGPGYYFAPKSAYAKDGDGVKGLKDLVKYCHKAGIEVVLEMPFAEGISGLMVTDCLRNYVMEYHVDGFIPVSYTHLDVYKRQRLDSQYITFASLK